MLTDRKGKMSMNTFCSERMDSYIAERMEKEKIPGLSITLAGPDGILYDKAYGYKHGETRAAVDGDTIMGVASMSKSFTGVCIALLEYEGKLSMDDPVTRFFPLLKIPGTPKDALLIRHLLSHTPGLPPLPMLLHSLAAHTVRDPEEKRDTDVLDNLLQVDTVEDIIDYINNGEYEPLGQPGEYMSYCNDGYAILSSIVDMAAGMDMESFLEKKLFAPLGMSRSALGFDRLRDFDNVTQVFSKGEKDVITASDNWSIAPPYRGCGWIISTSRDMVKYYRMLAQGGVHESIRILPQPVAERILGNDFATLKTGVYTYGLTKTLQGKDVLFTHSGGLKGVSSAGAFLKDRGVAGTVLTNLGGVDAMRILMGAFNVLKGAPPDAPVHNLALFQSGPQEPWLYEGFFGHRESGLSIYTNPVKVTLEKGVLTARIPKEDDVRHLHFCGENRFLAAKPGDDPLREGLLVRFFVRDDRAWAALVGSRMHQRI